jgi:membrane-associated phospholipid phosphatase
MSQQPIRVGDHEADDQTSRPRVQRSDIGLFVLAYAVLTGVWYLIGRAILASDAIVKADTDAARWFVRHRTSRLDDLTAIGSSMSQTLIKIVVTIIIASVIVVLYRRWREPMMIVLPLILEAMVFISVTWLVGRPRPNVPRLEGSSVDSSFPSGHAAAATVYSAVLIVVFWHTRRVWIRLLFSIVTVSVALIVGVSRAYRGMHHVTDVLAGFALGAMSIAVCGWLIERAVARHQPSTSAPSLAAPEPADVKVAHGG